MQILKVKSIIEFETAEVPEDSLLVLLERQADDSYLWRCKDSENNTGTIGTGVESVNGQTGADVVLEHSDIGAVAEDLNAEYGRPDSLLAQMMFFIRNGAVNLYATLADLKTFFAGYFADIVHDHAIADITDLQIALDDRAATLHAHVKADISDFAHGHSISEVANLQASLDGKAVTDHNHDIFYAAIDHSHSEYALSVHNHDSVYSAIGHNHTIAEISGLQTTLDGKAAANHNHDAVYAAISHDHDAVYAAVGHTHNEYALTGHDHDGVYSAVDHGHAISDLSGLQTSLDNKQPKATAHNLGIGLTGAISLDIANGDTQYGALSGATTLAYGAISNLEEGQGFILQLDNSAGQTFEFTAETFGSILILDSGNSGCYKIAFSKVNGKIYYDAKNEVYC